MPYLSARLLPQFSNTIFNFPRQGSADGIVGVLAVRFMVGTGGCIVATEMLGARGRVSGMPGPFET
jgi:hypothetical protein